MPSINNLIAKMQENAIANLIISDPYSIAYFTGYFTQPGERLLLLLLQANGKMTLYLNELFPPFTQGGDIEVQTYHDGEAILDTLAASLMTGQTSIDKKWPSHFLIDLLAKRADLQIVNATYLVDDLRAIKSPEEQDIMRQASKLNDQVMAETIQYLTQGLSEVEIASFIKDYYQKTGHSGLSFEPIVAYGPNGADPHHTTSLTLPQAGDSIVIDIGGLYQGYASDMTRTAFYKEMPEEAAEVYNIVRQANEAAIDLIRPGIKFSEIDAAARTIISEKGYGPYFTHRLGHFIGQEAHEFGDVSAYNHNELQVGQIFSIEPGIYLPNKFGIRIEDLVIVTADGCEVLNQFTKEPIIIP